MLDASHRVFNLTYKTSESEKVLITTSRFTKKEKRKNNMDTREDSRASRGEDCEKTRTRKNI